MSAVRLAVTVLVAGALLGIGVPAAERGTESRTATRLDGTATTVTAAIERFARTNDAVRRGGARRSLGLRVPAGGTVRLDGEGVAWRVDGGPWHRHPIAVTIATGDGHIRLGPGRHRLRLELRRDDGPVVLITRALDSDPEVETESRDQTARVRRTGLAAGA